MEHIIQYFSEEWPSLLWLLWVYSVAVLSRRFVHRRTWWLYVAVTGPLTGFVTFAVKSFMGRSENIILWSFMFTIGMMVALIVGRGLLLAKEGKSDAMNKALS